MVKEHVNCSDCFLLVIKQASTAHSDSIIRHQDRAGLYYPSEKLVRVLYSLKNFVEVLLKKKKKYAEKAFVCSC